MNVRDDFSGPGGWCQGARLLGLEPLGVEWDGAAVATRKAEGLRTVQGDVAATTPDIFNGERTVGYIASPPCPSFSAAGKGAGRREMDDLHELVEDLARGVDSRDARRHAISPAEDALFGYEITDESALLVAEPIRMIRALRPEWVALEQVPPVLPLWQQMAGHLAAWGYSVWCGILTAEQYGVPQTRRRAILVASRVRDIAEPPPTHTRYRKGHPRQSDGLLPWVSMADALGWGATARPYPTIACSSKTGGPDMEKVGGSAGRRALYEEQASGNWIAPAEEVPAAYNSRDQRDADGTRRLRAIDEPTPTIAGESRNDSWVYDRPATTVAGDDRIHPPGHKINQADRDAGRNHYDGRAGKNAIRVTADEAAVLQSFRRDYRWQGSKSKVFQQIGNAVPPLLAAHILATATGRPAPGAG